MRQRRGVLLVGILVLGLAGFFWSRRGSADGTAADVATVSRAASLKSFVTASGEIVATRYADIGSASMGRLVSLSVKEGDRVKAGQVLARIDPVQASSSSDAAAAGVRALESDARGAANQVRAAQADLAAARARASETEKALRRARELRQGGLTPQAEFDTAQAAFDAAEAQVNAAEASLQRAEQSREAAERRVAQGRAESARARDTLSKTEITAPIDGMVTRLDVEEGEMVVIGVQNQPGTILMTVSDMSAINAEVKVAEADVLRLKTGNTAVVTLEALPGQRFDGRVAEIGASALPQVGTQAAARDFKVKVRLAGALDALRPGLTCDAEILVAERTNVLTVPLQAVVQRTDANGQAQTGVFVVDDGRATFTPVKTGIIGGLSIEVEDLAEGASIVSGPFQVLRELQSGAKVRPRPAAGR
jgi:HlyD family secretion protein